MARPATNIPKGIRPAQGANGRTVYEVRIRYQGVLTRFGTYPTLAGARVILKEVQDKRDAGTLDPKEYQHRITLPEKRHTIPAFVEVVDDYLERQYHLAPSSYATYETACNKIKKATEGVLWTQVTPEMIQRLVLSVQKAESLKTLKLMRESDEELLEDLIEDIEQQEAEAVGKRGRPKKTGGGVHTLVNVLRNVYAYAEAINLPVPTIDPLYQINTFIAKHEPFLINPFTEEEKHYYLDNLHKADKWFEMWSYGGFGTGGRLGEIVALTEPMLNFNTNEIKIWRQYHKGVIRAPKFNSMRTVSMPHDLKEKLLEWLEQIRWERKFYGREAEPHHWIFPSWKNPQNYPLSPRFVAQYYCEYLHRIGLPHRRVHDIRHTVATRLIRAGEDPHVVADILGHKDVTTTLKIYVHVSTDERRQAMEKLFSREGRPACPTCKRPLSGPHSTEPLPLEVEIPG